MFHVRMSEWVASNFGIPKKGEYVGKLIVSQENKTMIQSSIFVGPNQLHNVPTKPLSSDSLREFLNHLRNG
jgi:hypothetical protein